VRLNLRKITLLVFLAANMAFVVAGALRFKFETIPLVGEVASDYGIATGSSNSFGFFCSVPLQLRPRFFVDGPSEKEQEVSLFDAQRMSREAELHHLGTIGVFKDVPDKTGRDQLIRSWAATLFTRFPDTLSITVRLELYEIPTPEELRRGEKPVWRVVNSIRVTRVKYRKETR
jgi:hypothetical protein